MPAVKAATAPRLAGFYAAYFGTAGVWLPFWPVWLKAQSLDAAAIGWILAAGFGARVAISPLFARYADARGERKPSMVALAVLATLGFAAFAAADTLWQYVALSAFTGATFSVLVPLGDSLSLRHADTGAVDYGKVRLFGSLAFIAVSAGAGRLLTEVGGDWILGLLVAGAALTTAACLLLPGGPAGAREARAKTGALRVVTRPTFLLFLVTCGALQASHAVYYGFSSLHWRAAGLSDAVVGLLWAEGVLAEVLLFLGGTRLMNRLGPTRLFLLAGLGGLTRWTVLGTTTDLGALALVQGLHALTFAAAHLGAMRFLSRFVPEELSATAQSVYSSVVGGVALGGVLTIAGTLYGHLGGGAFYLSAGLSAAGIPLALLLARSLARARG